MTVELTLVCWTILCSVLWIYSCKGQPLDRDLGTCSEPDDINTLKEQTTVLLQLFNNQAMKMKILEKELVSIKEAMPKLDQANKTEMLEEELNSVHEAVSKLNQSKIDQVNKTEMLEKELNSVKEQLPKLDQANKTKMLEKGLISVHEALSILNQTKLDQVNKTEMLEKALNSVKELLPKLNQANKTEILEKGLNSVEEALSKLNQSNFDQAKKAEMLEKELNSVKEALSSWKPDQVAFHVVASSNSSPGVVIFDHVITNHKFGYDRRSGKFTVPITGLYVFSWSIETYGQLTEAALLVNGLEMGVSKSDQASTYYDTTTSFAVLSLARKDEVWIRLKSGRAEAIHTMFSGWMISKTNGTAFYASLSHAVTGSSIIYNNKILDTDDAYSTTTGKFVAPRSGLYVFMVSGLIYGRYEFSFAFSFSNGISQPNVWVDSTSGYYDSSSYMAFAWMNSGDSVYINAERMMSTSMFAGWLLIDDTNVSKSTYPGFLAHIGSDSSRTPVVYEIAHGGYHHGYSTSTGVFTADRDGLYLFLYNTEAYKEVVRTAFTVNGVEIFETRSDGRRAEYDDTSAVTLLKLSSNDRVYIEIINGTIDERQSLFFGILLFEI